MRNFVLVLMCLLVYVSCTQNQKMDMVNITDAGKLFIIGGGKRPPSLIRTLVRESGVDSAGYGIILPMSSAEPDSAIFYAMIQFTNQELKNIVGMNFSKGDSIPQTRLDSLVNAKMIYISGGDQNRFMDIVANTSIEEALWKCYERGGTIAGTSAGAAVMSKEMITGNELKHPEYSETFENIESDNIELKKGLGFLKNAIIDQHFVKRSRHNRLISAILENPDHIGVGIDESTAILVQNGAATVLGNSQVLVFHSPKGVETNEKGKLSTANLNMSIYTHGKTFKIE